MAATTAGIVTFAPSHSGLAGVLSFVIPRIGGEDSVLAWVVISVVLIAAALRLAPRLTAVDRRAIAIGFVLGTAGYLLISLAPQEPGSGPWRDAWNYFGLGVGDPYSQTYVDGGTGYLPPFFEAVTPLRALGWPAFLAIWSVVELGALWYVVGPLAPIFLLVPLVGFEVWNANINLVLAAAIVLGLRRPAAWSFVLLTKFTLGVGLLWFVVRGELRPVLTAIGVAMFVSLVSLLANPGLWSEWARWLASSAGDSHTAGGVLLITRIAVAAGLVIVGARTGRPWLVPIAAVIALPVIWPSGLTILLACLPATGSGSTGWASGRGRPIQVLGEAAGG